MTAGWTRRLIHGLVKQNAVVCELFRCVVTKRELSKSLKLSVFKSIFVSVLTYPDKSREKTEKLLSQSQAAQMRILRKVNRVTLRGEMRRCNNSKAMNATPIPLPIKGPMLRWFSHVCQNDSGKIGEAPAGYSPGKDSEVSHGTSGVTISPTLLSLFMVWSKAYRRGIQKVHRIRAR